MIATNHTVTGIVIALAIKNPFLALPLAFISHFVLDAIPHFGNNWLQTNIKAFELALLVDMAIAMSVLLFVFFYLPNDWHVPVMSGIVSASPDLAWIPKFLKARNGERIISSKLDVFLGKFQYERPWGIIVEILWFVVIFGVMTRLLANYL